MIKKIGSLFILLSLVSSKINLAHSQSLNYDESIIKQRIKLKNLAFCKCLEYVDSSYYQINDYSAAGFFQFLAYDEQVTFDLKPFVQNWLAENKKKYVSKTEGSILSKMICLDFYNSILLDSFVVKQDNKLNKELLKEMNTQSKN